MNLLFSGSRGKVSVVGLWVRVVLAAIVLTVLWRVWMSQLASSIQGGSPATARQVTPRDDLLAEERTTIDLFRGASPSAVYITTTQLRRDLYSFNVMEMPRGSGSGFVWDQQGHIVTNFHVIQQANRARVILSDQTTWDAKLVGAAPNKDLAVLKIEASADQLHPLPIGVSETLQVGQKVFAIGNPFGLDQTLTTGVISGLGREIQAVTGRPIQGVIQTDAAINPGNSGGPLLDSAGRLIGVNTAIFSPSGAYAGIGFAVPVDTVNRIVPQLINEGRVQRPGLGVVLADPRIAARLGVQGLLILDVAAGSGADEAGLRPTLVDRQGAVTLGDIIQQVDGQAVRDSNDLYRVLDRMNVGDTADVRILRGRSPNGRGGRELQVQVRLTAVE